MKIVNPNDRTTLLLNKYHEAFGICTARAAFRHLMNGRVVGIDAKDAFYSWDGSPTDDARNIGKSVLSTINWKDRNIEIFDDQPALRSAPDIDGNEVVWFVPTVVRCNRHFGYRAPSGKDMSLRNLYEISRKTCQYCLRVIPFSEATKDHQYPRCRGGSNHEFNLVLACKECNNSKDDIFPYKNIKGEEVKPIKPLPSGAFLPEERFIRDEWRKYLFLS